MLQSSLALLQPCDKKNQLARRDIFITETDPEKLQSRTNDRHLRLIAQSRSIGRIEERPCFLKFPIIRSC